MTTLRIPRIKDDADILGAALAYAREGWYVLPLFQSSKIPALGKGWQHQSSRDPEQIVAWFAGTDHALGLHVGRSGGIVFDLDVPELCPPELAKAISECDPPRQSTRETGERGHVVFMQPPGRSLGNGRGGLKDNDGSGGKRWGEVRGANGFIAVEPSYHEKADQGGRYKWIRTGPVPMLPDAVARLLPEFQGSNDASTDHEVETFLRTHTGSEKPHLLKVVLEKFALEGANGSRHEALVEHAAWAMREARVGLYPAQAAWDGLWDIFDTLMNGERFPRSEFRGVMAWAIGQAMTIQAEEHRQKVEERLDAANYVEPARVFNPVLDPGPEISGHDPKRYFDDKSLDVLKLALDVMAKGPIAVGKDDRFWAYEQGVWRERNDEVKRRTVQLLLGRFRNSHAGNVETVVRAHCRRINCEPVEGYVNFTNGMLNWRTGELEPHNPDFQSTVQLPFAWDPEATCPDFDIFLSGILTQDYVDLAWEMIGYLMYSGNPMQVAFLFHGSGENGKGTLLRIIGDLLGNENYSSVSLDSINTNRFSAAQLFGKIANLAGDIDATYQESTANFKKLTGEDAYDGEHKYGAAFRFVSWAVPVFSANKIPGSADTSVGYLRRWIVLNFGRRIERHERILGLSDRLRAERPGIAVKAIEALRALMERGSFEIKGDVARGHEEFAEAIDQVRQWIDECCEPDDGSEPRDLLYKSYRQWAQQTGSGMLKASEFYHRLDNAGYKAVKVSGVRKHRGLRVTAMRMLPVPFGDPIPDSTTT